MSQGKSKEANISPHATQVSYVDVKNSLLFYRGYDFKELCETSTFEEVAYLLLFGKLPKKENLERFQFALFEKSILHDKVLRIISEVSRNVPPLSVLQLGLSGLSSLHPSEKYSNEEMLIEKMIHIIAQIPLMAGAFYRYSKKLTALKPLKKRSFTENIYYLFFGTLPDAKKKKILEKSLISQMDLGLTFSTFALRCITTNSSNPYSVISSAVGGLNNHFHGQAGEFVDDSEDEDYEHGDVKEYFTDVVKAEKSPMQASYELFKRKDPRIAAFLDLLKALYGDDSILDLIEEDAKKILKQKKQEFFANIDFWSSSLYRGLGFQTQYSPVLLLIARSVGWCAHFLEMSKNKKAYTPSVEEPDFEKKVYTSIEDRV